MKHPTRTRGRKKPLHNAGAVKVVVVTDTAEQTCSTDYWLQELLVKQPRLANTLLKEV